MRWKFLVAAAAVTTFVLGGFTGAAGAATGTRSVTEFALRDGPPDAERPFLWYRWDTRTGGGVNLTTDFGDPSGDDNVALALTTNHLTSAKAQLYNAHVAGTPLSSVTELTYNTFHDSDTTGFEEGNAALQLVIDFNGGDFTDGGFTTLSFEPYLDNEVLPDVWQEWNATENEWYSSRAISCDAYTLGASQGSDKDTLAEIATGCPDAYIAALGVNVGSNNPNYVVGVDRIHIASAQDDLTWEFGPAPK